MGRELGDDNDDEVDGRRRGDCVVSSVFSRRKCDEPVMILAKPEVSLS